MGKTNHARGGEALEPITRGCGLFIEGEIKSNYGDKRQSIAAGYFQWRPMRK